MEEIFRRMVVKSEEKLIKLHKSFKQRGLWGIEWSILVTHMAAHTTVHNVKHLINSFSEIN